MSGTSEQPMMSTHRTRIKICGLTRERDVTAACAAGADALGFVFYPKSKRFVTPERAGVLARERDIFVSSVGLLVEPDVALVSSVIECLHPSYLQFHGDESAEFCGQFDWPYIKAFRVGAPGLDTAEGLLASCREHLNASAWLFDSYTPAYGGSGHSFDHALLELVLQNRARPVILSGGLNHTNVTDLVKWLQPAAVDVSSGVEFEPGVKSPEQITQFVQYVRLADTQIESV